MLAQGLSRDGMVAIFEGSVVVGKVDSEEKVRWKLMMQNEGGGGDIYERS